MDLVHCRNLISLCTPPVMENSPPYKGSFYQEQSVPMPDARPQGSGHGAPSPPPRPLWGAAQGSGYPLQGIQYLTEHKLLTSNAQDIARFLHKGEGLNKTAIGTYLGER